MSAYVAGIDGGQSSTIAVIGDEHGRIVGRGRADGADEIGAGKFSTRLRDALQGAVGAARLSAGLTEDQAYAAIVAGVSGYSGKVYGEVPEFKAARFVIMHDAPIAHAGALAGEPGVVVIAGTGSVVYATDGARGRTTGGWGYLFGDEGSAFWLVREALAELMRAEDDGQTGRPETRTVCEFFGEPSLRHVARAIYANDIGRDRFASFAPLVCKLKSFRPIVERGAHRLAQLAAQAVAAGAHPLVSCVGGVFDDAGFRALVEGKIAELSPAAKVVPPRFEPAVGALLLAYREAGIPFSP